MKLSLKKNLSIVVLLILIPLILSACTGENTPTSQVPANPAESGEITPIPTEATAVPATIYLEGTLPDGNIDLDAFSSLTVSASPDADLWFGPITETPEGDEILTSTWVYALAAPFPTLIDGVTLADLQAYWSGETVTDMLTVPYLKIPSALANVWEAQWGEPDASRIIISNDPVDADRLWESDAWAIVPFDSLEPKLKVITVDETSPLNKDYDPATAPLVVSFQLIAQTEAGQTLSAEYLETLNSAIALTNRDPEKMTSLVMTGVTALVRATADKMETNGINYPGEKIRDWLAGADLTHISNEVSFYEDCPTPDPDSGMLFFCSSPDYIELFDYVGADIIELTGNHNNDSAYVWGVDVVPFSLDLYAEHGMVYFGGGIDLADALTPLTLTDHGNKLAFIGCNASGPDYAWATDAHGGAAPCGDYEWMADEIARLRAEGYLPIATFQYFEDYYNYASEHHVRDFGLMADAGAVIVNGSQAHLAKGMAFQDDAFIQYGLGNLFFDQMGIIDQYGNQITETRWEVIQRHTFYDGHYLSTELLTAMLDDYAQPRPMTAHERAIFLQSLFDASGWESR
ncbi:MAG: CapA family protein [Anaerolineaceae bacterium]|nr:CapA family protein [Anaerolineaceae bacterium]